MVLYTGLFLQASTHAYNIVALLPKVASACWFCLSVFSCQTRPRNYVVLRILDVNRKKISQKIWLEVLQFTESLKRFAEEIHLCPILSTRFQWTKPGFQRRLVEKWNRGSTFESSWVTGSLVIRWNRMCKQYFQEGWKVVRWSPSDLLETYRFDGISGSLASRAMSQNKHAASVRPGSNVELYMCRT